MARRSEDALLFVMGLLTGMTIGALATLLTTPYTGKEVRGKLVDRGRMAREKLRELRAQIEREFSEKSGKLRGEAAEKLEAMRKRVDEMLDRLEEYLS